jgi:hypothetical protein
VDHENSDHNISQDYLQSERPNVVHLPNQDSDGVPRLLRLTIIDRDED